MVNLARKWALDDYFTRRITRLTPPIPSIMLRSFHLANGLQEVCT
jgi:hypothetical protein